MNVPPILKVINTLRRLSFILLIAIVAILSFNLILSISKRDKSEKALNLDTMLFAEKKEMIHFQEVREGQKEHLRVKAERHYLGEDGLFHLEGNVEIVFPRKQHGEDVAIRTDSLMYDQEFNHFWSKSPAQVEWGEVKIEAERVDYYAPEEVFEGKGKVKVKSNKWSLDAEFLQFMLKTQKIVSYGNVSFQLAAFLGSKESLVLRAQRLSYDRRTKIGLGRGGVSLQHGASQGKAEEVEFNLDAQESFIKWLKLRRGVKVQLQNEWEESRSDIHPGLSSWFYLTSQSIDADGLNVEIFARTRTLKTVEIIGGANLKFFSDSGSYSELKAAKIRFFLTQERRIKKALAENEVSLIRKTVGNQDLNLKGEKLEIWGKRQIIIVSSGSLGQAFLESPHLKFKAGEIEIKLEEDDIRGKEGVEATIEGQIGSSELQPQSGFFNPQTPYFLTCQEMRRRAEGKRLVFMGEVKIWQGDRVLKAERVILDTTSSHLEAKGKVEVNMISTTSTKDVQHLRIRAEEVKFDPSAKILEFNQNISLHLEEVEVNCSKLLLYLEHDTQLLAKFEALGQVKVSYQNIISSAQEAEYQFSQQVLIMTGEPLLEDPARGKIRGDKLTFHLPDDRIVIENKGEERSLLLIKS